MQKKFLEPTSIQEKLIPAHIYALLFFLVDERLKNYARKLSQNYIFNALDVQDLQIFLYLSIDS